jgi:hypothetical protein
MLKLLRPGICKIRWIGLDEEADRVNTLRDTFAVVTLPPETD